ncbi:IPT/TIG domain-containing protein [Candidatus Poribacteria bacterium]|nr:IPT/TIG domain-containing protein [Candidatus Poribacteria bacterium]
MPFALAVPKKVGVGISSTQYAFVVLLITLCFPSLLFAAPTITQITPFSGQPGDVVTIKGSGFSTDPTQNEVRFGPNRAAVRSATATQLTVQVPTGQPLGTTNVTVTFGGTSNSKPFICIMRSKIVTPPNPPVCRSCCEDQESNTSNKVSQGVHSGGSEGGQSGNIFSERGEFYQYETDLSIPGRPGTEPMLHYAFRMEYRAQISFDGPLGHNWDHNYFERL